MMKNLSILKQFIAIGALLFVVTSCGKKDVEVDTAEQQDEIPEHLLGEPVLPSYEVATIQKDGHEYLFEAIGEEGDMVIIERLYGAAKENLENSGVADGLNPFEAFLLLTDDNVKIPSRIAATVDESVIAASNREIDVSISPLEILDPNYSNETEDRNCVDMGSNNFENQYCYPYINNSSNRSFCHASARNSWHIVNSGSRFKKVRTYTHVANGTSIWIRITQDNGGHFYDKIYQKELRCGTWWVNLFPNTSKRREVHRTPRFPDNVIFRSYTRFSNN